MSQPNRIWIMAGQSWMHGQNGTMTGLQAGYVDEYLHNNRIWETSAFEVMDSRQNNNQYPVANRQNGCSIEFYMKDIADYLGNDIYILKYAQGSTGLAIDGAADDWNTGSTSELYDGLVAEIALVESWMTARGKSFQWEGLIWWQGETDTLLEADSLAYQTNLQSLYDGLNTATGTTLKCYQYNIELPPSGNRPYLTNVNSKKLAFTNVSTSNRRLFDTDAISWNPDNIHPTVIAYKDIWDRVQKDLIKADL